MKPILLPVGPRSTPTLPLGTTPLMLCPSQSHGLLHRLFLWLGTFSFPLSLLFLAKSHTSFRSRISSCLYEEFGAFLGRYVLPLSQYVSHGSEIGCLCIHFSHWTWIPWRGTLYLSCSSLHPQHLTQFSLRKDLLDE